MNDTAPNIAALVRERLLSRPGAERVVMGSRMFDVARTIVLASFRQVFLRLKQSAGYASGFMATSLMSRLTSNTSFNQKFTEPSCRYQSLCAFQLLLTTWLEACLDDLPIQECKPIPWP